MSTFNNYSFFQILIGLIHLLSPLFLVIFFFGDHFNDYSFFQQIAIACIPIIFLNAYFFGGSTKNIKTGRSFKTKSGIKLEEYEEIEKPGIPMPNIHMNIFFIHIAIPIITILTWLIPTLT